MASKPINIPWTITLLKNLILQTIFQEYQNKNLKIYNSFVCPELWPTGGNKTGFNLRTFNFNIRGKLFIIRCDK